MQGDTIRLPYHDREDVVYFEVGTDPSQQLKQKPDVELYRRFPWLEFKNPRHKKKYTYLGRETEQSHPFYVRFSLAQEVDVGSAELSSETDSVDDRLKQVVAGVVSPENLQEKRWREGVLKMNDLAGKHTLFTNLCVHHGYLLTGIARPSTTANDAYDALFPALPRTRQRPHDPEDSGLAHSLPRTAAYNLMKLAWEYKFHSYEYFRFMGRAYRELSQQLGQRLHPDEVEEATSRELFNFNRPAALRYLNSHQKEEVMFETDYFCFFSGLLSRNHKHVLEQMELSLERNITVTIDGSPHQLREFDFETYLRRQFSGAEVSEQSLGRMVEHNRKRHTDILLTFPFTTRRNRLERLRKLANDNKEAYNRVELLPMVDLREHTSAAEEDRHFIILFRREEGVGTGTGCSLRELAEGRMGRGHGQGLRAQDVKVYKERLFQDIYRQQAKANEYPLLNYFSCNPDALLLEEGVLVPDFERPMRKLLELDRLPLTHEQELLACTPSEQINPYEKLEKLVEEYEQCLREDKMDDLCRLLSDEWVSFEKCDQSEELRMEGDGLGERGSLKVKMKLLQVGMIDYELTHNRRCLHVPTKDSEELPFNAFTPAHYKQLRQLLALLLTRTSIFNALAPSPPPPSPSLTAIDAIRANYLKNCQGYIKYTDENANRRFFRQVDQDTFRKTIKDFFEDLEAPLPGFSSKIIKEALRVAHKAHLVLEVLEARLLFCQQEGALIVNEELVAEGLEQLRPCVEAMAREEKEGKSELYERCKTRCPSFLRDLKEAHSNIQKELLQCRELLQYPLRSEQGLKSLRVSASQRSKLHQKIELVSGYSLLWLCSVYSDIMKYSDEQADKLLLLYKILMCFCCHLPQFHRNQVLQHEVNFNGLSKERLEEKIYKFKNVLLTELAGFIVRNRHKYLPTAAN